MRLYDIAADLRAIFDDIDDAEGEITPEQEEALDALTGSLEDKVDAYGFRLRELKAQAEALKAEERWLAKKRKGIESQIATMRKRLHVSLDLAERRKVKTSAHTVSIRAGRTRTRLVLDDVAALMAAGYVTHSVDERAVQEALDEGKDVPAHVEEEQGDDVLTIR